MQFEFQMKAEGTIAHGGERAPKSHGVKRAVVDPVQSELNGDKYQTAISCPPRRMLQEPTCNRETDGSGCEPKTFVVDDGDGAGCTGDR